jgi:hypothetical protein
MAETVSQQIHALRMTANAVLREGAEIIGYSAPLFAPCFAERWKYLYEQCANILHLNAETKEQLDHRLNADEEAFGRMQAAYGR